MDIRAAEISKVIKDQIASFGTEAQVSEVGQVLSVGDGRRLSNGSRASLQVREGDRVLFSAYAGVEVVVEREELLIMGEDEILAILD